MLCAVCTCSVIVYGNAVCRFFFLFEVLSQNSCFHCRLFRVSVTFVCCCGSELCS